MTQRYQGHLRQSQPISNAIRRPDASLNRRFRGGQQKARPPMEKKHAEEALLVVTLSVATLIVCLTILLA